MLKLKTSHRFWKKNLDFVQIGAKAFLNEFTLYIYYKSFNPNTVIWNILYVRVFVKIISTKIDLHNFGDVKS